jgi:hypothetical protein
MNVTYMCFVLLLLCSGLQRVASQWHWRLRKCSVLNRGRWKGELMDTTLINSKNDLVLEDKM